ncbi:MAG: diacylglycerol kinase [Gammaproteobacteria bacterium]|nr:diacylglycerol kinase [Gammaproteobacteria bacterium]
MSVAQPGLARRWWRATRHSLAGLRAAWRHEAAFREELVALALLTPLALYLGDDGVERALLLGSWLLVMVVELLNSAVEAVIDRIGEEPHALAGRAKDLGSAAVLIALLLAVLTWGLVLWR